MDAKKPGRLPVASWNVSQLCSQRTDARLEEVNWWSTLPSRLSWSCFWPLEKLSKPSARLGTGTKASRNFSATPSSRLRGMMLPAKGWLLRGSVMRLDEAEKSPLRSAAVGGVDVVEPGSLRSRVPW